MNNVLKALRVTATNLATLAAVVVIASLAGYGVGAIMTPPNEKLLTVVNFMYLLFIVGPGMFLSGFGRSFVSCAQKMFYFSLSATALFVLLWSWYVSPQASDMASFLHLFVDAPLVVALPVALAAGLPLFFIVLIGEWIIRWGD